MLSVEILEHYSRLRECRMEMLRYKDEISLFMQSDQASPESASGMLLTLTHLFWDVEWFRSFLQGQDYIDMVNFLMKWACLSIEKLTTHHLSRKRLWRLELHERVQLSAYWQNCDDIPAFWMWTFQRVMLVVSNLLGTSIKLGVLEQSSQDLKKSGLWSLLACNFTSEGFDCRRSTTNSLSVPLNTSVADVGSDIAPMFAQWLIYEGHSSVIMKYAQEKCKLPSGASNHMNNINLVKGEMSIMMQRQTLLKRFTQISEWKDLLDQQYLLSPLVASGTTLDTMLVQLQQHFPHQGSGDSSPEGHRKQAQALQQISKLEAMLGASSMHHKCSAKKCQKTEQRVKEFLKCGRCKVARYCSVRCQKNHWKHHKKSCKAPGT